MPAMTRLQLQTRVGDLIGDPNNTRWSTAKVQDKIQEAQEHFSIDTQAYFRNYTLSVGDGDFTYTLPTTVLSIYRVIVDNIELQKITTKELDALYSDDWTTITGTPTHWRVAGAGADSQELHLFPIPTAADAGTNNLRIFMSIIPDAMASDGDYPFTTSSIVNTLFYPYHPAVSYWAASEFLLTDPTPENLVKAKEFMRRYTEMVDDCINYLRTLMKPTPLRFRGGRYYSGLY